MTTETTEPQDYQEALRRIMQIGESVYYGNMSTAYVDKVIVKDILASLYILKYICEDLKKCEGAGTARVVALEMLRYSIELQSRVFKLLNDEGVRNG
jgi:hypothetical protein